MKLTVRNRCLIVFATTTVCYIFTKWLIFKGFNGSDDLHYAMLAARMLSGEYDPFQPGDIFSGRILLIASQAAVYKIAGINIISTQAGSLLVVILSCYLTVRKLLPVKNSGTAFFASSLFYFNPVITNLSFGIRGDLYVLLAGIIVCILLKSWAYQKTSVRRTLLTGSLTAFIIALSLLYKETMLVFLPFAVVIAFLYGREYTKFLILSLVTVFSFIIILYGLMYYHYAGDALFKITQINNSSYPNHCSYDLQPLKVLIIRLTYGEFQEFITTGFYPVIFGVLISACEMYKKGKLIFEQDMSIVFFVVLLLSSLYFPFSFHSYQPLCSDVRQFLFLLPLGVIITTGFLSNSPEAGNAKLFVAGSLLILACCVFSTGNKWQWMIYLLLSICYIASVIIKRQRWIFSFIAIPGILWLSLLEHLFFKNSNWFFDMVVLNRKIASQYYYFPDHDNMMHWQLLHRFDRKTFAFYNLQKRPFKVYGIYYQHPDINNFHPGWLILNHAYNVRSAAFLKEMDALKNTAYFTKSITAGDISALWIDTPARLAYVRSLIESDSSGLIPEAGIAHAARNITGNED